MAMALLPASASAHNFDFDFVFMEEVDPIQPVATGDIVVNAFEVSFDAKGSRSSACNESIWFEFDPTFSLQPGAGAGAGVGGDVNVVHSTSTSTSTPFTFIFISFSFSLSLQLQPVYIAKEGEGYELINFNCIMEDYVAHNGSIGQDSSELLEKFTCMRNFYSNLTGRRNILTGRGISG